MRDSDLAWMLPGKRSSKCGRRAGSWTMAAYNALKAVEQNRREWCEAIGEEPPKPLLELLEPVEDELDGEGAPGCSFDKLPRNSSAWAPPTNLQRAGHPLGSKAAFDAVYELKGKISHGSFSTVFKGVRRHEPLGSNDALVAIKVIRTQERGDVKDTDLRAELDLMRQLDHPNVIRTYDAYYFTAASGHGMDTSGEDEIWLLEEMAAGGECFSWCRARRQVLASSEELQQCAHAHTPPMVWNLSSALCSRLLTHSQSSPLVLPARPARPSLLTFSLPPSLSPSPFSPFSPSHPLTLLTLSPF